MILPAQLTVANATSRSHAGDLGLVGRSAAIERVRSAVRKYAFTGATVLITGETGTGKELIARALHERGDLRAKPLVIADASALHANLFQSELFGHQRGAFTGAVDTKRGLVEEAHGGTLFIDEVGELSAPAQAALLRFLESGETRSLGATRSRHVDVRVVAATHRDLVAMMRAGQFREDLFHRLCVLVIRVPPLRERSEDIALIANHLLARMRTQAGEHVLSDAAADVLARCPWPGNARQLLNTLRRAVVNAPSPAIDIEDIVAAIGDDPTLADCVNGPVQLARLPRRELPDDAAMCRAFVDSGRRAAVAARALGMARSTLRDHLKRMGVVLAGVRGEALR